MSTFQERIEGFSELPNLKTQGDELKLKLESLEKIKDTISEESYHNLSTSNLKKLNELNSRITDLQLGISSLIKEIELDSKVLESENTILEKELQELQFLSERGALSKQDYDVKRSTLQQKINKNKSLLGKNQSGQKELDFYASYIGPDSYLMHTYNRQIGSIKAKLSDSRSSLSGILPNIPSLLKSKGFISIILIIIIIFIASRVFRAGEIQSVKIGDQVWMSKNLDVDHYRNGDPIPQVQDKNEWEKLETGAWCYYENNRKNGKTYGKLYNWYAVKDPRGLASKGWHIPTAAEWTTLTTYLGGESVAGGKLKETGTTHWTTPNAGATDETGFTALPGGLRNYDGPYHSFGSSGNWWSSSEDSATSSWYWYVSYYNSSGDRSGYDKRSGFSVRCIQD